MISPCFICIINGMPYEMGIAKKKWKLGEHCDLSAVY